MSMYFSFINNSHFCIFLALSLLIFGKSNFIALGEDISTGKCSYRIPFANLDPWNIYEAFIVVTSVAKMRINFNK